MNSFRSNTTADCLTLESKLSEIARVPPWIERLASLHAIPGRTRFAMDLCLEEVLSNIIRHGYSGKEESVISIRYLTDRDGFFTLVVEDEAPPFNPLAVRDPPSPQSLEDISEGGQGIHLLKQFADAVEYELKPTGNRLIISFISPGASRATI
jgi:anti-sigma regulatory factor (Ser/Thr protein kinase)